MRRTDAVQPTVLGALGFVYVNFPLHPQLLLSSIVELAQISLRSEDGVSIAAIDAFRYDHCMIAESMDCMKVTLAYFHTSMSESFNNLLLESIAREILG